MQSMTLQSNELPVPGRIQGKNQMTTCQRSCKGDPAPALSVGLSDLKGLVYVKNLDLESPLTSPPGKDEV